jgi:lipoprotein NlpD
MRLVRRLAVPRCLVLAAALMSAACGGTARAPVLSREDARTSPATVSQPSSRTPAQPQSQQQEVPAQHVVVRGDTLFSIAWRYGLDWRDVAAWNGIRAPYVIVPGQRIHLRRPPAVAAAPPAQTRPQVTQPAQPAPQKPPAQARPQQPQQTQQQSPPRPVASAELRWQWPTQGQVLRSSSLTSRNGVDISGTRGQSIVAAAPGAVVYSGTGLRGYGRLIIIKHNDSWLSAYAHNDQLLVKEGDQVQAGQPIATMGLGNDGRPVLHFEIRKDGKPVNPLDYLPKRSS